ncbi:MAG: ATP synthase F1 subunit gamma [Treponema sp.]|jgi:F-type H+-transporting ATPase subunit gamma|nr:ATP synthase F1 subunit gamma [Treponema sp.]
MANLRDLRLRMRAIKQTLQVTRAMSLISTAKLRKGRRMLEDTSLYFTRIQKSMFDILSGTGRVGSKFLCEAGAGAQNPGTKAAIVIISSDKGLAGGYNANVFRYAKDLCERVQNPALILIGNVGYRHFIHSPHPILENFSFHSQIPTLDHADEIAEFIISQYLWGAFHEVHVAYTHMYNTIKLQPAEQQLFPLSSEKIQEELSDMGSMKRVSLHFEFLPSAEELFDALVPLYIRGLLYSCMVEAYASEQSARMAAMDAASKSAEEILADLQISYNRERQAGITQEISEIVGGSAALNDK